MPPSLAGAAGAAGVAIITLSLSHAMSTVPEAETPENCFVKSVAQIASLQGRRVSGIVH
jgi:hypothetical protein